MAQLNIRIDEAARAGLDAYAEARGMATGDLVRQLIDQAIKDPRAAGAEGYVNPYNHTRPATLSYVERRTLAMQHRILALLGTRPSGQTTGQTTGQTSEQRANPSHGAAGRAVEDQWGERLDPMDLADGDAGSHLRAAEALEHGYTAEYPDLFVAMEPELSDQACDLVHEILTMFRVLQFAWSQLAPDEQQAIERSERYAQDMLSFRGFDANDPVESRLLGYARYLLSKGLYVDLRETFAAHDNGNSHARQLGLYQRLLAAYRPLWRAKQDEAVRGFGLGRGALTLTAEELHGLARASMLPRTRLATNPPSGDGGSAVS